MAGTPNNCFYTAMLFLTGTWWLEGSEQSACCEHQGCGRRPSAAAAPDKLPLVLLAQRSSGAMGFAALVHHKALCIVMEGARPAQGQRLGRRSGDGPVAAAPPTTTCAPSRGAGCRRSGGRPSNGSVALLSLFSLTCVHSLGLPQSIFSFLREPRPCKSHGLAARRCLLWAGCGRLNMSN